MICRLAAGTCTLVLALCTIAAPAAAQSKDTASNDVVVEIPGPCLVAINSQSLKCAGVAYTASPDSGRVMFTAVSEQEDLAFSGDRDDNEDGHYILTLDSVLSRQTGVMQAKGQCEMLMAEDGRTVRSIECLARTQAGTVMLKAAGVAKTGADNNDQDDDDDDDGDGGPDVVQA